MAYWFLRNRRVVGTWSAANIGKHGRQHIQEQALVGTWLAGSLGTGDWQEHGQQDIQERANPSNMVGWIFRNGQVVGTYLAGYSRTDGSQEHGWLWNHERDKEYVSLRAGYSGTRSVVEQAIRKHLSTQKIQTISLHILRNSGKLGGVGLYA